MSPLLRIRHGMISATAVAAVLMTMPVTASRAEPGTHSEPTKIQTTRTFHVGPGRATRTFTFHERSGVILLNRLTVRRGVRAFVDARIPHVAGAKVSSLSTGGASNCGRSGAVEVCAQGEEWCPMPQATWHFRLVKLSGPAGAIRFEYVVAPPPPSG
jgi:hypothetical protein